MTNTEIRIAIAEKCGWEWHGEFMPFKSKKPNVVLWSRKTDVYHSILPDYPNDLNAMHEAEKVLTAEQKDEYVELLSPTGNSRCPYSSFTILHATARQRAEAFLKVFGLWK